MRQFSVFCLRSVRGFSSCEKLAHFLVGRLRKVVVPLSDAEKWPRRLRANNFIHSHPILIACLRRRDRSSDNYTTLVLLTKRGRACSHCRSCRLPLIDLD